MLMLMKKNRLYLICAVCIVISLIIHICINKISNDMEEKNQVYMEYQELQNELETKKRELKACEEELEIIDNEYEKIENTINELKKMQAYLEIPLQQDESLYTYSIGDFPVNYDVEGFKENQAQDSRVGTILSSATGGLFGSLLEADSQNNAERAQKNRAEFYKYLSEFINDSYFSLVIAKQNFDECYQYYRNLSELADDADIMEKAEIIERLEEKVYWDAEKKVYLDALAKYHFDLKCVYLMYENTLSSNETVFLSEIKSEIERIDALLEFSDLNKLGYTEEEKDNRYLEIMEKYIQCVKGMVGASLSDPSWEAYKSVTAYRVGFMFSYGSNNDILLICESKSLDRSMEWYRYYDRGGEPIYLLTEQGTVILREGKIISYSCQNEDMAVKLVEEAIRIYKEYELPDFERNYYKFAF